VSCAQETSAVKIAFRGGFDALLGAGYDIVDLSDALDQAPGPAHHVTASVISFRSAST
jgi:hypothetical protein